ncbi:MAG: GxxExxY protein [Bacteroidota bacterium]|nr:GxxExxY protein [Bacteroidota bacterium]
MNNFKHSHITDQIIKAFYSVYNNLSHGFLEKIYENAMIIELKNLNISVVNQIPVKVFYNDVEVGNYHADLLVENKVIVELKSCESLCEEHEAQLTNYLRATEIEVGLLLNFGSTAQLKRKVYSNEFKKLNTSRII